MTTPILTYRHTGRDRLTVDFPKLIASKLLLQAASGGGKSWAIRQLCEETYGKVPQIIIDPEGEFHTLREQYDYVLVAVRGGDIEASPKTAALLARRLVELSASAVIDLSEMKPGEQRLFVRRFLEAMLALPRDLWHPTLVVIDEFHLFAPESGHGEAESLDACSDFSARARKRGFCLVGATTRIAKLHKDVAGNLHQQTDRVQFARRRHRSRGEGARVQERGEGHDPAARTRNVLRLRSGHLEGSDPRSDRTGEDDASGAGHVGCRRRGGPAEAIEGVTAPQQRILNALAGLESMGIASVDRSVVAVFADQSPTSSGYGNNLGRLRTMSLIDYPTPGVICLTDAGRAGAEGLVINSVDELHSAWQKQLPAPQWNIVAKLIEAHPDAIHRESLAEQAGQSPTSSGYGNNLGRLRTLGIIGYKPGQFVHATSLLFPEGLS